MRQHVSWFALAGGLWLGLAGMAEAKPGQGNGKQVLPGGPTPGMVPLPLPGQQASPGFLPTGNWKLKGNNGVGNGIDPPPPGNPPINDGPGTRPGFPGNRGGKGKFRGQ
jgi:hypothetical protein